VTPESSTGSVIYPSVQLGANVEIEPFCLIGRPADAGSPQPTHIGQDSIVRSHSVIYDGTSIGANFATGHHVTIRNGNRIGDSVSVGTGTVLEHHIEVGDLVRIHSSVFIPEYSVLESACWIGPRVVITNAPRPRCPEVSRCISGVTVRTGAKVGANATLLPGVVIGENALVGAGSVVTRDVPAWTVVAGNPARVVNDVRRLSCPAGLPHVPYV
jgi:acetyltransferase-like isoleucine patch superfamily enzyme